MQAKSLSIREKQRMISRIRDGSDLAPVAGAKNFRYNVRYDLDVSKLEKETTAAQ
jgi:hypothetical protein